MEAEFISLFVIVLIAAAAPLIARVFPNGLVPETVVLLVAGALLGPHMASFIELGDSINLLSELGLAFLFLLAGFEIDPKDLTSSLGKRGLATWIVTALVAFAVVFGTGLVAGNTFEGIAIAIALTTTALGTVLPILKERGLLGTSVGTAVLSYGTWGELGPILAMALLLGTRAKWETLIILVAFVALCIVIALIPSKVRPVGRRVYDFLISKRNGTSQTLLRITIVLLIGLVTVSAVFELDIVLGAFAAGFVLRYVVPEGSHELEGKLEAIGYGFFIPLFFIVSGAKIDISSVASNPRLLIGFLIALLLVRAMPILIALSLDKSEQSLSRHNRVTVALYCTTALPLIVAVTTLATKSGAMSQDVAGTLVAAGALSVLIMPLMASLTYRVVDVKPVQAVKEIAENPHDISSVLHEHALYARLLHEQEREERRERQRAAQSIKLAMKETLRDDPSIRFDQNRRRETLLEALRAAREQFESNEAAADLPENIPADIPAEQRERYIAARKALRSYRRRMRELGREMLVGNAPCDGNNAKKDDERKDN